MPYVAEISRKNPTCFLFLIDRSGSMASAFGGQPGKKKAEGVADAVNRLLQNLALKCAKSEGIRDYFHVGVIGYGDKVGSVLSGPLEGKTLLPIGTIANHPLRVEQRLRKVDDGTGGLVEQKVKFPVWVEPRATGKTPMCEALGLAVQVVREFIAKYPACYPPVVINLSDGRASDGDPTESATHIRELVTRDGPVLLFNSHLSSSQAAPVEFPARESALKHPYARQLFRMSNPLPAHLAAAIQKERGSIEQGARGMVFNADLVSVIRFLDIGTRVATKLG